MHLNRLNKIIMNNENNKKEPDKIVEYRFSTPLRQTHAIGVVSFILSIIGLFTSFLFPFAIQIIGIILGHISKSDINANPDRYTGRTLVTAGLIINYLVIIFSILFLVLFGAGIAFFISEFTNELGQ